jgi:hypothetical protein
MSGREKLTRPPTPTQLHSLTLHQLLWVIHIKRRIETSRLPRLYGDGGGVSGVIVRVDDFELDGGPGGEVDVPCGGVGAVGAEVLEVFACGGGGGDGVEVVAGCKRKGGKGMGELER